MVTNIIIVAIATSAIVYFAIKSIKLFGNKKPKVNSVTFKKKEDNV